MAFLDEHRHQITKASTEFVGTTFLCLIVALTGYTSMMASVVIGCTLMVLVYAGGHISGGHYNPAVTLAVFIRGGNKIDAVDASIYIVCQLAGGLCGALLSWPLIGKHKASFPGPGLDVGILPAFLCELMITFALCSVFIHTTTTKAHAANSHHGLAVGFTVLSGVVSVGGISGGAFNPAVGVMPVLYGWDVASRAWVYWVAPAVGGIIAGVFFRVVAQDEYTETPNKTLTDNAPFLVEVVGTMLLCFTVGMCGAVPARLSFLTPLSIGAMFTAMIYMGGAISGAHYNPAFTLAALLHSELRGRDTFTRRRALEYLLAQLVGAALGTFYAWGCLGSSRKVSYPSLPPTSDVGQGIFGESLGTFLLVYVFLNVTSVRQLASNPYTGLAIGMVITIVACAIGPVTGGAFNPAVGLIGPFSGGGFSSLRRVWIYWVGCPLGAALATGFFWLQNQEDRGAKEEGVVHHLLGGTA